jgi:hypothetical protein
VKPKAIVKRDGSTVPFELPRIAAAILQAQRAVGYDEPALAAELARVVDEHLERINDKESLGIEEIQDAVVHVLQESGNYEVAIAYTRYRDARERFRRSRRLLGEERGAPNLHVVDLDGRRRGWDRAWLRDFLAGHLSLGEKAAEDAVIQVEALLVESPLTELSTPLLLSLVDAALVRCGMHHHAEARVPLRLERRAVQAALATGSDAQQATVACGRQALLQLSLTEALPSEVLKLWCLGRLWADGLDDPQRGSHYTATVDGSSNPWQVLTQAFALATEAAGSWRRISLVLPPSILGHLERGALSLVGPVNQLAQHGFVYLYCDGRTPLLDHWPFVGKQVSIATYADDFLLLRRLQELHLPMLAGPHLMQGGYRRRVAVELALNAQGLDNEYSQMDLMAMGLVSAAKVRLAQLARAANPASGEVRFAIYGLPASSPSHEYLERQVVQEGLRNGLTLVRTTNLPEEACAHLGRLLE